MKSLRLKIVTVIFCVVFSWDLFAIGVSKCLKVFSSRKMSIGPQETVKPLSSQDLIRHITEGALLSKAQELEFQFYLHFAFRGEPTQKSLKDVWDVIERYPAGQLDKLPVREQEITYILKKKSPPPENLPLFLKSFRSYANRVRRRFQVSANWGDWAKLLSFERHHISTNKERRERFFEYLNSGPLGQPLKEFIKDFQVSSSQTVKEFIEDSSNHYMEKTIVLYKVLDRFRQEFIKKGQGDLNEKLSIAMVELIHVTGFGNPNLTKQLKSKDPAEVIEALRQIILERDTIATSLGFRNYEELKDVLLDSLQSNQVKMVEKELSVMEDQVSQILADLKQAPEIASHTETFRMRPLTVQESPFRGCLGKDCSTRAYFKKALDPAYLYFTLTDSQLRSRGHITVVLGTAKDQEWQVVKTAFVDKIQNIPNDKLLAMLEAIRQSLSEQDYRLALPKDVGDYNGLSGSSLTSDFVKDKILKSLTNKLRSFEPKVTGFLTHTGYSRADLRLDLLEFELTQAQAEGSFKIRPGAIHQPKKIDESFKIKRWVLRALKSKSEKDQLLLIAQLPGLVNAEFLKENKALSYLKSKIEDTNLSFELRKRAMFSVIHLKMLNEDLWYNERGYYNSFGTQMKLQEIKTLESLLLKFSDKELKTLIGEMSNWKNTTVEYRRQFIIMLSNLFSPDLISAVIQSRVPGLFKSVVDLNIKNNNGETSLHLMAGRGAKEIIRLLHQFGVDLNIQNDGGETPLHYAVKRGHKDTVQLLHDLGADFSVKDDRGETLLYYAVTYEKKNIIQLLHKLGADLNIQNDSGQTPLLYATHRGYTDIVRLLYELGADLNSEDFIGGSALYYAIKHGYKDIVRLLHELGVDLNKVDRHNKTALYYAIQYRQTDIVRLLFELDMSVISFKNELGDTALHYAVKTGYKDMVQLLLGLGADPNSKNYGSETYELFGRQIDILPDPNSKNDRGETPLHYAIRHKHKEISQLLSSYGAK